VSSHFDHAFRETVEALRRLEGEQVEVAVDAEEGGGATVAAITGALRLRDVEEDIAEWSIGDSATIHLESGLIRDFEVSDNVGTVTQISTSLFVYKRSHPQT